MKCLFAMKFYSLIWHINEEAFGVRQRPGGSYRWQRCCSTLMTNIATCYRQHPCAAHLQADVGLALVF